MAPAIGPGQLPSVSANEPIFRDALRLSDASRLDRRPSTGRYSASVADTPQVCGYSPHRYSPITDWATCPPRRCVFARHWRMLPFDVFMPSSALRSMVKRNYRQPFSFCYFASVRPYPHSTKNPFFICNSLLLTTRLLYPE